MVLGWGLAFRTGVGVAPIATMAPPPVARIQPEEALPHSQFGEGFDAYRARTSRPIPGLY